MDPSEYETGSLVGLPYSLSAKPPIQLIWAPSRLEYLTERLGMIVPHLLIVLVVFIHQSVDACWVVRDRLANTPVVKREYPPTQNCSSHTYTADYHLQSLDKECGPCLPGPERFHCPFRPPTVATTDSPSPQWGFIEMFLCITSQIGFLFMSRNG